MPDLTRDDILLNYLDQLPYEPYPVQEEALMAYFSTDEGVLVCAPTGTGKTLIAEAALYEALQTGKSAYYTTPLIALTEQKFTEVQDAAEKWGFNRNLVGLVTGNRSVNPDAPIKVVVAEILLNRLHTPGSFSFDDVACVVMDEFHSFADPERGIVWELSLAMLPANVRLMLLSATVGNGMEFLSWLKRSHKRDLQWINGTERKVPLTYHWENELLPDLLASMSQGDEESRKTPALVFCFDREKCWNTAELLRGKDMLNGDQQKKIAEALEEVDTAGGFSGGIGPKLKRILLRGIGVHHAGLLPKHRRLVEELFQQKLLSICVCTETLAAGMNLPARSVVITELLKGPKGRKKVIAASNAHQMFGRAGRPQFDTQGHVYAVAHEDDVKILRHKEKVEQIPEDSKDPKMRAMRKKLEKKTPKRREGVQYWSEAQFEKLQIAEPGNLESKGHLPWRLLAFLLNDSPDVTFLREAVDKRMMIPAAISDCQEHLKAMLATLHEQGFVQLSPPPPMPKQPGDDADDKTDDTAKEKETDKPKSVDDLMASLSIGTGLGKGTAPAQKPQENKVKKKPKSPTATLYADYQPIEAKPTSRLKEMLVFRAVQPLYGAFLLDYLGQSDKHERMQIMESLLELPGSVARHVRVPHYEDLPPGLLATEHLDPALIQAGLFTQEELYPPRPHDQDLAFGETPNFPIPLAEKMYHFFQNKVKHAGRVPITAVWCVGDLVNMGGNFNDYIQTHDLAKQEGVIFKHLLRMILLCEEFMQITPHGMMADAWQAELKELITILTASCREVDPLSTDETLTQAGTQIDTE
ncbi:MAG TPA: helicase [Phycisphaerales bacterium]|nr:helicase [Phycisphaerales bacterium]HCD32863.1 helicase [Phycisphaerales bacterium]|tara:strand:+ start:14651 stop:17080 length:2430 start_codon:yes stop_codon:yes gene_type:complete